MIEKQISQTDNIVGGGDLVCTRYDKQWGGRRGKRDIIEGNSWPGNKEVLTPGKREKKVSRTGVRSGVLKPLVRSGVRGKM